MNTSRRSMAGFSLVELMVALVAGMIVVGAVLAFTISGLRSNADYIQTTRLTQDLRTAADFVSRELRRSGYDESALSFYAQSVVKGVAPSASKFSSIRIENATTDPTKPNANACVLYAYDLGTPSAPGGSPVLMDGEIRGIRRVVKNGVGIIEVAQSKAGVQPACDGASPDYDKYPVGCSAAGWCPLTDNRSINISMLAIDTSGSWNVAAPSDNSASPLTVRALQITIRGSLIGAPEVERSIQTQVRVRTDCLQAACNTAPVGV